MDPFTIQDDNLDTNLVVVDPNKNYLEELVGEDKKFKSPEELARAKAESDAFILRLQNELAGIRNDLKTRTTMQEFLDRLETQRQTPAPNNQQDPQQTDNRQPYTPEELREQVKNLLSEQGAEARKSQNYREATETLSQFYGHEAPRVVQQKAQELGLSLDTLKAMAEQSPKAFLTLVGATGEVKPSEASLFSPPPATRVNTGAPQKMTGERTESYYNKLRDTNPNAYWSPAVQNQLHKDAIALGERFFT